MNKKETDFPKVPVDQPPPLPEDLPGKNPITPKKLDDTKFLQL